MRFAFLILVHRYPAQVIRLIETLLKCDESEIFVHVDLKSPDVYFELEKRFKEKSNVHLIENRYKVFWGSFGQIKATAALLESALKNASFDYCLLLSGQDMPIKKFSEMRNFFLENRGKQFLMNFKLPDQQWDGGGLERLQHFHFDIEGHPWFSNKLNAVISKAQRTLHLKRPIRYSLYGGSNWLNLSHEAVSYIVKYLQENPKYLRSFRFSRTADEIFIQTILLNSPMKNDVVSRDLRYIDWASGPEYPRILRVADFEKILDSENCFFGRKFDATVDSEIIEKLIEYVGS